MIEEKIFFFFPPHKSRSHKTGAIDSSMNVEIIKKFPINQSGNTGRVDYKAL